MVCQCSRRRTGNGGVEITFLLWVREGCAGERSIDVEISTCHDGTITLLFHHSINICGFMRKKKQKTAFLLNSKLHNTIFISRKSSWTAGKDILNLESCFSNMMK